MNLHNNKEDFYNLSLMAAHHYNISQNDIMRDYYIIMMLSNLSNSIYKDACVFKGGTSLSKCYERVIKRFSEDIDLTFIPINSYNDKKYDKTLKKIEEIISNGFILEKIPNERNQRNKSSWIFPNTEDKTKIKLEIGSNIMPYPYAKKEIKSYIQEYLEHVKKHDLINKYELTSIAINVLDVRRTFIDKVMAVKRHAICGTLSNKARHIYDVAMLYEIKEIKDFLNDKATLKNIISKTKETDSFYLTKRNISKDYNPLEPYNFDNWKDKFDKNIESHYKNLKKILLDKNIKLDFKEAFKAFTEIDKIFAKINE